jgi:uncharacterized protein YndB with AHSA1/START domain
MKTGRILPVETSTVSALTGCHTMAQSSTPPRVEIVTTRVFAGGRARVYEAFSNPEKLQLWWGPKGFTNTFHEFDLREGGAWRFVMHGPDGTDYENAKDFLEVVPLERVSFVHLRPSFHRFTLTMSFEDEGPGTRLTWRMIFESAAENEKLRDFITQANEENFDRLEAFLTKTS